MTSRPEHVIAKEFEAIKKLNWRETFEAQFKWGKWPKGHPLEGQKVRIRISNNEPVGFQQYKKEYFAAKKAQGLRIRKGEHVNDSGLSIKGPGSGKGQVKFARDKKGKLIPHPVHGRPMTVKEAEAFAAYEAKKNPPPVAGKDGAIIATTESGKKVKILPNTTYYNAIIADPSFRIPDTEAKAIKQQAPLPLEQKIENNKKNTAKIDGSTVKSHSQAQEEYNKKNTNNLSQENTNQELAESTGKTDLTIKGYNAKHPQVGRLMINPGGWVDRNADVRSSDRKSTTLSIAQRDFGRIKKGETLGVLTKKQRARYDREVLGLG